MVGRLVFLLLRLASTQNAIILLARRVLDVSYLAALRLLVSISLFSCFHYNSLMTSKNGAEERNRKEQKMKKLNVLFIESEAQKRWNWVDVLIGKKNLIINNGQGQ